MVKDMYTKTNTSHPLHAHIFVDNSGERQLKEKKLDCDNQAKLCLKRNIFKGEGAGERELCFIVLFKISMGFIVET